MCVCVCVCVCACGCVCGALLVQREGLHILTILSKRHRNLGSDRVPDLGVRYPSNMLQDASEVNMFSI